jgi:hypothetical protein
MSRLVVLALYAAKAAKFKYGDTIPDLDNTLLGIFGVSHGIHLSGKYFELPQLAGRKGDSHGKHGNR